MSLLRTVPDIMDKIVGRNFFRPRFLLSNWGQVHPEIKAVSIVLDFIVLTEDRWYNEALEWAYRNAKDPGEAVRELARLYGVATGKEFVAEFTAWFQSRKYLNEPRKEPLTIKLYLEGWGALRKMSKSQGRV